MGANKKAKKGEKDMDYLKQELELDEHKIPIEELFQRHTVNPDTVCICLFVNYVAFELSLLIIS